MPITMENKNDNALVLLRVFSNAIDAHIAYGVLQTNGIECVLNNENMSSIYPMTPVGEVLLYVRREDEVLAEQILNSNIEE